MLEQYFFYYEETAWFIAGTSDSPAPPRPWEMFRAMMVVNMCVLCGVGYATMRVEKSAAGEMEGLLPESWDGRLFVMQYRGVYRTAGNDKR